MKIVHSISLKILLLTITILSSSALAATETYFQPHDSYRCNPAIIRNEVPSIEIHAVLLDLQEKVKSKHTPLAGPAEGGLRFIDSLLNPNQIMKVQLQVMSSTEGRIPGRLEEWVHQLFKASPGFPMSLKTCPQSDERGCIGKAKEVNLIGSREVCCGDHCAETDFQREWGIRRKDGTETWFHTAPLLKSIKKFNGSIAYLSPCVDKNSSGRCKTAVDLETGVEFISDLSQNRTPQRDVVQALFEVAIQDGNLSAMQRLKEVGAETDRFDSNGFTPFSRAVKAGDFKMIGWLGDQGADVMQAKVPIFQEGVQYFLGVIQNEKLNAAARPGARDSEYYFEGSRLFAKAMNEIKASLGGVIPPGRLEAIDWLKDHGISEVSPSPQRLFAPRGNQTHAQKINYAKISVADPLNNCPLENLSLDLSSTVNQLVSQVRDSVSKIKEARAPQCQALQSRLDASQAEVMGAIQHQFITGEAMAETDEQRVVNLRTQQASAVNGLLLTASDMFHRDCLASMDDKIIVQRLIGQVITLGGLFMGGWQGLITATGGLMIGNLPLFRDEIDTALEIFKKYDEKNQRGSFLCLYRQMLKTTSLLFATENDRIVGGLDLSFEMGPTYTTIKSVERYRKAYPELVDDLTMLYDVDKSSDALMPLLRKPEDSTFDALTKWCSKVHINPLKATEGHLPEARQSLIDSLTTIQSNCGDLNAFKWLSKVKSQADMANLLNTFYWNLNVVKGYEKLLLSDQVPFVGDFAKTVASLRYFEDLRQSFEHYRDSNTGNQARLNYNRLTTELGNQLAKNSFNSLMKENRRILTKSQHFYSSHGFAHSTPVRRRALQAILDLCQTFDPTLTRLYVDDPTRNKLHNRWVKSCGGADSTVCKAVVGMEDYKTLLDAQSFQSYYSYLCTP
jgi:hypothetical protein